MTKEENLVKQLFIGKVSAIIGFDKTLELLKEANSLKNAVIISEDIKKECLHNFHSVYYGSEWEVECEKCDKNVRDLYSKEDALFIIEKLIRKCQK